MLMWIKSPVYDALPFLLLDRDGIINEDRPDYIKHSREFRFYPDALQALRWLRENHVLVVLISNQSGLNRDIISWDDFWDLHKGMVEGVREAGGDLLGAFYCPHRPEEACSCRKPSPGMIKAASEIFHIPLPQTYLIGDRSSDMIAAARAGCQGVLLDRSAHGIEDLQAQCHVETFPGKHGPKPSQSNPGQHSALSTQHYSPPELAGESVQSFASLMEAVLVLSETWKIARDREPRVKG
jgi:D-glycero-D-manno-heptose 1,7-bisphosphate phosphatase